MNLLSFFQSGWRWVFFWLLAPFAGFLVPAFLYFLIRSTKGGITHSAISALRNAMAIETSLVIITLNRAALLEEALASLEAQTRRLGEIVVVDNGPSEETALAVRKFEGRLPVRRSKNRAGAMARQNRGLREAQGEILLSMDDDCRAGPDWWTISSRL